MQIPKNVFSFLKGLGQIMLQENALTGVLFLAGIFWGSPLMGVAALLSVCTGTLTAIILKYDSAEIKSGLYGFSAALVGVALMLYFQPTISIWIAVIPGAALATILQHLFIIKKIPVFTLPFVLVTWCIFFLFGNKHMIPTQAIPETPMDLRFIFRSFGQIIFQSSVFAGILFVTGVLIQSPIAGIFGITGCIISATVASWLSAPSGEIAFGLYSYNAILCAIVFAGKRISNFIYALLSSVVSVLIFDLMVKYHFTPLTFPFVLASMITIFFMRYITLHPVNMFRHKGS